jgi:hypothetical protein
MKACIMQLYNQELILRIYKVICEKSEMECGSKKKKNEID